LTKEQNYESAKKRKLRVPVAFLYLFGKRYDEAIRAWSGNLKGMDKALKLL
jgi:hypothetical protein